MDARAKGYEALKPAVEQMRENGLSWNDITRMFRFLADDVFSKSEETE